MFDVIGIESPVIDMNVNVDKLPQPNRGERVRMVTYQGGGKVSSGMVASARLGAKCAMIGTTCDDSAGRFLRKDFADHGINVDSILTREGQRTFMSIVLSDKETGGRSIMGYPGTMSPITEDEINWDMLRQSRYFFIANASDLIVKAVDIARESGVKIFIDADHYTDAIHALIPKIDVFVGSEFFYNSMFQDNDYEKNMRTIMDMGPEIVVFTFGERGCVGISKDEPYFELPAFKVDVVDTVGAGDVYHGAFVAGLAAGRTVRDTARFASAVSAIKCTRIGGRAGIPDLKTVERFMEDGYIDYTEIDQRVEGYRYSLEQFR